MLQYTYMRKGRDRGFTLIEMLVVIAIIGILAVIVMVSLSKAKGKARDATRREALKTLASGLEAYRAENSTGFPTSPSSNWVGSTSYIPELVPSYMTSLPQDSGPACTTAIGIPLSTDRHYWYKSDGTGFKIVVCAENTVDATDAMYDPVRPGFVLAVCHGSATFDCNTN